MAEDKDILLDEADNETENDNINQNDDSINESAISGEISKFIRFMMDDDFGHIDLRKYTDMAWYLVNAYEKGYEYSYYNVSAEIYAHWDMDEQQLTNLSSNIESLKAIVHQSDGKLEKALKGIDELYDHIMLEIVRITDHKGRIDKINEIINKFQQESKDNFERYDISLTQTVAQFENKFREADELISKQSVAIEEISKSAKKLKKKVNNVYSQFVSILGIFTAIVLVFFGGVSVFSNVLTNIHQAKWYQIGFGVSAIGIVMFDVVFMFLYILSKLVGTPISVKEESDKRGAFFRWIDKYPYLFWFNFICLVMMFICA